MLKSFSLTIAIAINVLNQTTLRPVKLLSIFRENYRNTSLPTHTITEPDLKLHNQGFMVFLCSVRMLYGKFHMETTK